MASTGKRKKQTGGRKKRLGPPTVRSSNRERAARAGKSDMVVAGRRRNKTERPSVIDMDSDREVFGVQMSERRRQGESNPTMPESKTKHTRSIEPKNVPKTGIAKSRKRT
jgi:hypothetical protein